MRDKPIVNPYLAVLVGVFAISFSALFVRLTTAPVIIIATYRLLFTFLLLAPPPSGDCQATRSSPSARRSRPEGGWTTARIWR